jgi:ABC-2 type transport system ATP-binding protein
MSAERPRPESGALEARELGKHYGGVIALAALDLRVGAGEIYALLGPNGAGKTTALSLLLGLIRPTSGWARVQGLDVGSHALAARRLVGYLPERVPLYDHLTGLEHLEYFASLAGAAPGSREMLVQRLMEVGLPREAADARASRYSKGMRQRVGLAIALVKDPPVLLLDEPFATLDPQAAEGLASLLRLRSAQGVAILFTSHDLGRARQLGTRIGILWQGRLVAEVSTQGLNDAALARLYAEHMRS